MKNKLPALIISIIGSLAISGIITLVMLVLFPRWNPGLIRALSRSTADYTPPFPMDLDAGQGSSSPLPFQRCSR